MTTIQLFKPFTSSYKILLALSLVLAITRGKLQIYSIFFPDASWAIFFLAGLWLNNTGHKAFILLIIQAVLIDYLVITSHGTNFFDHYCMSPAYIFLVPSYFCLWLGGKWLASRSTGLGVSFATLGYAAIAMSASEGLCYILTNGSFYWLSSHVPQPRNFPAWVTNLGEWYLPFLVGTAQYVAIGLFLHVLLVDHNRPFKATLLHN